MDENVDNEAEGSDEKASAPRIVADEVRDAIKKLPRGKAAGYDDSPAELIKLDSDVFVRVFCNLCNKIVNTGEWPKDWRRSVFITIPKVKGTARCDEHRTIALISLSLIHI